MFIFCGLFILAICLFTMFPHIKGEISSNVFSVRLIVIALMTFLFAFAIFNWPMLNSTEIATIRVEKEDHSYKNIVIYRDNTDGTYFYPNQSLFNPLKICYRVPIDADKVEKCLQIKDKYEEAKRQYNAEINDLNILE